MSLTRLTQQLTEQSSPLSGEQIAQLKNLAVSLNPIQQAWLSGYLAASANSQLDAVPVPASAAEPAACLSILYGSQTGNSKAVAQQIKQQADKRGIHARVINMADYKPNQLKKETHLVIAISTYGEGEPPEDAEILYEFLGSKKAPALKDLKVAVIGLGDSSYEFFCQTAIDFEQRLNQLGAKTVFARAELDVDYQQEATVWMNAALDVFAEDFDKQNQQSHQHFAQVIPLNGFHAESVSQYTKTNPLTAEIATVQKITGRDSSKDVRHIEIELGDSGLSYQPGDALGVFFANDPSAVSLILERLQLRGEEQVQIEGEKSSLTLALTEKLELTQSYPRFVEQFAKLSNNAELIALTEDKAAMREYLATRQIIDIIDQNPAKVDAQGFVDCLRKIQPRLYSIASSQAEVESEVHLTVAVVEYEAFGKAHLGGCSGYLAHHTEEGAEVRVFVEPNDKFRLPADDNTPIIMVGPGTGIAPFRAFLQERESRAAEGKNWLLFGERTFSQDFLYQTEIQAYVKSGLLSKIDLAFSRDQADKIYVQDRLKQRGAEVYEWLEQGAHFYVCGDANHMAKDVHAALQAIIQEHGGLSDEQAQQYLQDLRSHGRYQKDVY